MDINEIMRKEEIIAMNNKAIKAIQQSRAGAAYILKDSVNAVKEINDVFFLDTTVYPYCLFPPTEQELKGATTLLEFWDRGGKEYVIKYGERIHKNNKRS